jgi:hypothetical protein
VYRVQTCLDILSIALHLLLSAPLQVPQSDGKRSEANALAVQGCVMRIPVKTRFCWTTHLSY